MEQFKLNLQNKLALIIAIIIAPNPGGATSM